MTTPIPLSPAAQAVLDAAMNTPGHCSYEYDIGVALRAAVNQVITDHRLDNLGFEKYAESRLFLIYVREQFHSIAAELEAQS